MTRSNGWLLSKSWSLLPFLTAAPPASLLSAVRRLWAWVSRISPFSSSPRKVLQDVFPQVLEPSRLFSRLQLTPRKPTSLKNHGFPQGFNLLDNAVNSPQVVKNICTQACTYCATRVFEIMGKRAAADLHGLIRILTWRCTAVTSPQSHPGIYQCHWLDRSSTSGDSDDEDT
ncbi:hypothetical protein B0H14DRAFT_2619142 [Mycena olivaceomarginata]|nr:hypothetical protein B0H14DRAFT_2619142 [Mycena olivaceomarginata]